MINIKTISYVNKAKIFWVLAGLCLLSLFVYIYSINATARNIADRQNLERQVADKAVKISKLEFELIELKNGVTMELAREYGYREVARPIYVSRDKETSVTLNTVGR